MRVKYGTIWLSGATWQEEADDLPLQAGQQIEVVPLVRRAYAGIYTFGNRVVQVPVMVMLNHGSNAASADYLHTLETILPTQAALRIVEEHGDHRLVIEYAAASFVSAQPIRSGEATALQITFTVTAAPATAAIYLPEDTLETLDGAPIHTLDGTLIESL